MRSPVVKRSIVIAGHKTSVSLEDAFWQGLKQIAAGRNLTLSDLVASIDHDRRQGNLSSAIRLFVLEHYRTRSDGTAGGENPRDAKSEKDNPRSGGGSPLAAASALRPE
jgi:predicted DNA-binding ribbon-helix-helix protein